MCTFRNTGFLYLFKIGYTYILYIKHITLETVVSPRQQNDSKSFFSDWLHNSRVHYDHFEVSSPGRRFCKKFRAFNGLSRIFHVPIHRNFFYFLQLLDCVRITNEEEYRLRGRRWREFAAHLNVSKFLNHVCSDVLIRIFYIFLLNKPVACILIDQFLKPIKIIFFESRTSSQISLQTSLL